MKTAAPRPEGEIVRKRVSFDAPTWRALDLYARDSMRSFQELMDEAVADLLRKHDRPVTLKDALARSTPAATADAPAKAAPSRLGRADARDARRGRRGCAA